MQIKSSKKAVLWVTIIAAANLLAVTKLTGVSYAAGGMMSMSSYSSGSLSIPEKKEANT